MKKRIVCLIGMIVMVFVWNGAAGAAEWRFPVGLAYVSGFNEIVDIYKNNLEAKGYTVESNMGAPVGLSFQPYVQFDSGLAVGVGIGPPMMISSNAADFSAVPFNADVRFFFAPHASLSPYVRAGVRTLNASGDYVVSSTPGVFGGFGVEFARNRVVGAGFEVSYDTSEVELDKYNKGTYPFNTSRETVRPCGLMVSVFAAF